MRGDNLDRRIALANRIGADDGSILPRTMAAVNEAKSDPMAEGRRIGHGRDPAGATGRRRDPNPRNPRHLDTIEGRRSYIEGVEGTFRHYITTWGV